MKPRTAAALCVGLLLGSVLGAQEKESAALSNTFRSPTVGFTLTKPASWSFGTVEQDSANRSTARLEDKELEEQVRQGATTPLVVALKHPEPYHDDVDPTVMVVLRPLGDLTGKSAVDLMTHALEVIQRANADFAIVDSIQETKVGGQKAAYTKWKCTAPTPEGWKFPTLSRLWLVPRGKFMFMVSMSGPQTGADVSEKEFAEVLGSIKIDD